MGDLDVIGEGSITMRNINSTLQRMEEHVSPCECERDASTDILQRDSSTRGMIDAAKASERDCELETSESLRRRKRKQKNVSIHRVSSECAPSYQSPLSQQETNDVRPKDHHRKVAEDLQACGSPEILIRSRKRKRETSKVHEVGLDINLRTDGSHDLQALGFDISVSSSVAVGIKHASCSILPADTDIERAVGARLAAIGVCHNKSRVSNKREEEVAEFCEEVRGATVEASRVSNKNVCSTSTSKKSGRRTMGEFVRDAPVSFPIYRGKTDELGVTLPFNHENRRQGPACLEDQSEIQTLRMAVAALHSQFKSLSTLAENGSKDCGHCKSIKEELSKLLSKYGETFTGQVSPTPRKAPTAVLGLSSEEVLMCSSPVGSCTIERTALEKEACRRHLSSVLQEANLDSSLPMEKDAHVKKDGEQGLPCGMDVQDDAQEGSDAECHLCIELGSSSQSEDPDVETIRDGSMVSEDCNQNAPLLIESGCNPGRLHACLEGNQDCLGDVVRHGEVNSEVERHTDSFHGEVNSEVEKHTNSFQGVEEDRKGEELSAKSSKEEDCWNSAITRDSGDSCVGAIDDRAQQDGYIDLKCGCTSQKFGDTVGILRLHQNGKLEIQCQCSMECIKGKPMSPASFEKHGGRGASKKWRDTIWIVLGDQKVQFSKVKGLDAFVRRYKESGRGTARQPALPKQSAHRDEFLQCTKCLKRRRFRRKTKEECRLFHEASMDPEWECSNYPFESCNSCQDEEEREARQAIRGCARSRTCLGCIECVCVGCFTCRFEDCQCRLCTEYIANNK